MCKWDSQTKVKLPAFIGCHAYIDNCILDDMIVLWSQGIHTLGCCCGHGKRPSVIVKRKDIKKIGNLLKGWEIWIRN